MRAALIATGNEIVSGQIINTNASKLADLLSSTGVDVAYHLAVPDDEVRIIETFDFLKSKKIDNIFTIGGLGPTRDDLTRRIVSDYFSKKLTFRDDLWIGLKNLLNKREIKARKGHKIQCYFPEGAEALLNSIGTAHGFKTTRDNFSIWCLPGPPEELESVFENGVRPWLIKNVKADMGLLTWQCTDVSESEIAHRIEKALLGCTHDVGYRASPPIVEVKFWAPRGGVDNEIWINKIEDVVGPFLHSRQGEDYLKIVVSSLLLEGDFTISDQFSKGYLFQSIFKSFGGKWPKGLSYVLGDTESKQTTLSFLQEKDKFLFLLSYKGSSFKKEVVIDENKNQKSKRYMYTVLVKSIKDMYLWMQEERLK